VHKELQHKIEHKALPTRKEINGDQQRSRTHDPQQMLHTPPRQQQRSYSQVVSNTYGMNQGTDVTLLNFLEEFKTMFNQLVQQNNMILQMLSTVMHKLVNNV
jgi:hypothetical protein